MHPSEARIMKDKEILYRAIVSSCDTENHRGHDECMVFISAPTRDKAIERIQIFMGEYWKCPSTSIEMCNVETENELFENAYDELAGDKRLFEVGCGEGKAFYDTDVVILNAPRYVERLIKAKNDLGSDKLDSIVP